MAKGYDKHQQRLQALSLFGKDLTRRSGSQCELCSAAGEKLSVYEVPPVPEQPDFDHCLFACTTCLQQLNNPRRLDANHWRCLQTSAWSELAVIQTAAVTLLRRLGDHDWATDLLDQLYLQPDVEAWLQRIEKQR